MDNIALFPSRVAGRTVEAVDVETVRHKSKAGGYCPKTDSAAIPVADSAYARTVRLHESGHAIWSRKADSGDWVSQAVEDAIVHTKLDTSGSVRRDEVYAAAVDLRTVTRKMAKGTSDRALQGVTLLRAASILRKPDTSTLAASKLVEVANAYHPQGIALVDAILDEVRAGNIADAKALTSMLLARAEAQQRERQEGEGDEEGQGGDAGEGQGKSQAQMSFADQKPQQPQPQKNQGEKKQEQKPEKPQFKAKTVPLPSDIKGGSTEDYIPAAVVKKEQAHKHETSMRDSEDGSVTPLVIDGGEPILAYGKKVPPPTMYVHSLSPNAMRKVKGKGRAEWKSVEQGIKIRVNRLALNAANPTGGGRLFESRHLGGTVLIDASGSMSLTDKQLYDIAEKFPAGKVAYYSGQSDAGAPFDYKAMRELGYTVPQEERMWSGDLVVYAQGGRIRRDRGREGLPQRGGGNLVDYQALLWLLKQPAPRYLMTDASFTGPLQTRAWELLDGAVKTKKITSFYNMDKLMQFVRKLK